MAQGAPTDSEIAQSIIDELLYVTQNTETFAEEMTMEVERIHSERFATPSSILPPSYTAEANGYPALRRTGRLARSLGWGAAGRSADSIRILSGNTISFGTMRPGAAGEAVRIPHRRPLVQEIQGHNPGEEVPRAIQPTGASQSSGGHSQSSRVPDAGEDEGRGAEIRNVARNQFQRIGEAVLGATVRIGIGFDGGGSESGGGRLIG